MKTKTIAEAMAASKTARPSINMAREILQHQPRDLAAYRARIAARYEEFNRECRGVTR